MHACRTFNEVKDTDFPSILEQLRAKFPARLTIDRAILRVLGFADNEINQILDYLYPALANEIEKLKTLMQDRILCRLECMNK